MRIPIILSVLMTVCTLSGYAQSSTDAVAQERYTQEGEDFMLGQKKLRALNDNREVVGVAAFKCETETPFSGLVTEKVIEVLKNSNRFIVVDRTNMDNVTAELRHQEDEHVMDPKNIEKKDLAEKQSLFAAKKIVAGTITKIPVYRMKNGDGSVRGYKASVAFQMKVDDVSTGQTTQAVSFEGKASKECLSPEAAVQMAMNSLEGDLAEYIRVTFPLKAVIHKILTEKNGVAQSILIKAGKKHGVVVGDKFTVNAIEKVDGEELPTELGIATVTGLTGEAFSQCKVDKSTGQKVYELFNAKADIRCTLMIKK